VPCEDCTDEATGDRDGLWLLVGIVVLCALAWVALNWRWLFGQPSLGPSPDSPETSAPGGDDDSSAAGESDAAA
jgi:hypothetical protein